MIAYDFEHLLITKYRSKIYSKFIKGLKEYEMLKPYDKVCVCISGGKDSLLLAKLFEELKKHSDFEFDVFYMVMDPGYSSDNLKLILDNLDKLNIKASVIKTDIFEITKDIKNPCFLCAKMRRGALYRLAQENGCNKIALGHHYDDVIETTLMNMLNVGLIQTMLPKLKSKNFSNMELIRPMYFINEKDIISLYKNFDIKFSICSCNLGSRASDSKRLQTKLLIEELKKYNPNVAKNIFASMNNINLDAALGYKKNGNYISYLDEYDNE